MFSEGDITLRNLYRMTICHDYLEAVCQKDFILLHREQNILNLRLSQHASLRPAKVALALLWSGHVFIV